MGDLTKEAVREKARALGLETADKPESQEICFIPDDDYRGFLRRRMPEAFAPGPIVDGQGTVLGRARGPGQLHGGPAARPRPVLAPAALRHRARPGRNALVVGEAAAVEVDRLRAEQVNLISVPALTGPLAVTAKIRHSHEPAAGDTSSLSGEPDGQGTRHWSGSTRPQRAPAPGQSVVFYQGDLVVGGGSSRGPEDALTAPGLA